MAKVHQNIRNDSRKNREILISNTKSVIEAVPTPLQDTVNVTSTLIYQIANSTYTNAKRKTYHISSIV